MTGALHALAVKYDAAKLAPIVAHFCDFYEQIIPRQPLCLLEIGVQFGRSLRMWREWLGAGAFIGGVDCDAFPAGLADWAYIGRQEAQDTCNAICSAGLWDIIIDDASHRAEHQLATLAACWPAVATGGWYVIEDTHTHWWPQYGRKNSLAVIGPVWASLHHEARHSDRAQGSGGPTICHGLAEVRAQPGILAMRKGKV